MKHKLSELDVDFIGGERPLTKEDEKAISDYLKSNKMLKPKKFIRKVSIHSQKNVQLNNNSDYPLRKRI